MLPTISLGPVSLPTAPLLLMIGLYLGWALSERYAALFDLSVDHISDLILIGLGALLVGARLFFAIEHSEFFSRAH